MIDRSQNSSDHDQNVHIPVSPGVPREVWAGPCTAQLQPVRARASDWFDTRPSIPVQQYDQNPQKHARRSNTTSTYRFSAPRGRRRWADASPSPTPNCRPKGTYRYHPSCPIEHSLSITNAPERIRPARHRLMLSMPVDYSAAIGCG